MHPCSEIPKEGVFDNEKLITFEAVGTSGISVISLKNNMIVKIIYFDLEELEISCKLNYLQNITPVFNRFYGWNTVKKIPNQWLQYYIPKDIEDHDDKYIFLYMEKNDFDFMSESVKFETLDDYLSILFILIHGLYILNQKFKIIHDDIDIRNVMFQKTEFSTITLLEYEIDLPKQKFIPKIIDFGNATVEENETIGEDIDMLFGMISYRAKTFNPDLNIDLISNFDAKKVDVYDLLVNNNIFKSIRRKKYKSINDFSIFFYPFLNFF